MRQIGTTKSGGSVTDLNLEGSISEYVHRSVPIVYEDKCCFRYAKDIILVIAFV